MVLGLVVVPLRDSSFTAQRIEVSSIFTPTKTVSYCERRTSTQRPRKPLPLPSQCTGLDLA